MRDSSLATPVDGSGAPWRRASTRLARFERAASRSVWTVAAVTAVLFLVGRVEARIADADLVAKDSARRGPPGSPEGREGGSNEFTHTPHGARARDGTGGRPGSPRGLDHRVRSLLGGRKTIDDRRGAALP